MLTPDRWLQHLEKHVPIALEGVDPEGIHQVRVAGRRLRVLMELGGHRALVGDLRWLVRALGRMRDIDVLTPLLSGDGSPTEEAGDDGVEAWLAGLTQDARLEAHEVLTSPRLEGLMQALRHLPPLDEALARRTLRTFADRVRKALDVAIHAKQSPEARVDAIHALRRALRRLRYARDWLDEDSRVLKDLQDALGAMCDLTALSRLLAELGIAEGLDVSRVRQRLDRAHRRMSDELLRTPAVLAALG
ncbi:MAG: CHAD domain-containing protein [Myxococcota bacterium]